MPILFAENPFWWFSGTKHRSRTYAAAQFLLPNEAGRVEHIRSERKRLKAGVPVAVSEAVPEAVSEAVPKAVPHPASGLAPTPKSTPETAPEPVPRPTAMATPPLPGVAIAQNDDPPCAAETEADPPMAATIGPAPGDRPVSPPAGTNLEGPAVTAAVETSAASGGRTLAPR